MKSTAISTIPMGLLLIATFGVTTSSAVVQDSVNSTSIKSASVLEFADAKTLFVAATKDAVIHVLTIPEGKPTTESKAFNLRSFSTNLTKQLGVESSAIAYNDVAVHPTTRADYVSLTVFRLRSRLTKGTSQQWSPSRKTTRSRRST